MKTLLRLDLNVPITNGIVSDHSKISSYSKYINKIKHKYKLAIFTHLGRPKNKESELSTKNLIPVIEKLWKVEVVFEDSYDSKQIKDKLDQLQKNQILLLENTRFFDWEKQNSSKHAKLIASCFDHYIFDSFATAHRNHLSTHAISDFLPSSIGDTTKTEIKELTQTLSLEKPLIIMGGAKAQTKLMIIERFLPNASHILIGGILANTFLKAQGFNIQASLYEEKLIKHCQNLLNSPHSDKIILPFDFKLATNISADSARTAEILKTDEMILDIGPKTCAHFLSIIESNNNIIFNGPMGYIENPIFAKSSIEIIRSISQQSNTYLGGGDSLKLMKLAKLTPKSFKFVSMGGGAMLEFIAQNGQLETIQKIKQSH